MPRPSRTGTPATVKVAISLTPREAEILDAARGPVARGTYARDALLGEIRQRVGLDIQSSDLKIANTIRNAAEARERHEQWVAAGRPYKSENGGWLTWPNMRIYVDNPPPSADATAVDPGGTATFIPDNLSMSRVGDDG